MSDGNTTQSASGTGWSINDLGHTALDVFGALPVVGEAADLTNAVWYAAEGQYLDAGLSLISTIPIVGDLIGKGAKVAKHLGPKVAAEVLQAIRKLDVAKQLDGLRLHPKLGAHIDKIQDAIRKWQAELSAVADSGTATRAVTKCPDTLRATSSGLIPKVNPEKTTTVLGRFEPDMKAVKDQINPAESLDFGAKVGQFNMLNAPAQVWERLGGHEFFEQINKPFLDAAMKRGDDILMATDPLNPLHLFARGLKDGERALTTFGKEVEYLYQNGYVYDAISKAMIRK